MLAFRKGLVKKASLSEEKLEQLARNSPDVRLEEGEILFGPEEISERLFIAKEARVQLYKTDQEGNECSTVITLAGLRRCVACFN